MLKLTDVLKDIPKTKPLITRPEILLSSNTVKPMHGVVPRLIKGQTWWDETRQAAYRSTDFRCVACAVHKYDAKEHQWLEGHEVYKTDYRRGRMLYIETVPLCHYCHCFIHSGRLDAMAKQRKISWGKVKAVLDHGRKVLAVAGLKKRNPVTFKVAKWDRWRLVLDGEEHPPVYKDYKHWLAAFWETDDACEDDPG